MDILHLLQEIVCEFYEQRVLELWEAYSSFDEERRCKHILSDILGEDYEQEVYQTTRGNLPISGLVRAMDEMKGTTGKPEGNGPDGATKEKKK